MKTVFRIFSLLFMSLLAFSSSCGANSQSESSSEMSDSTTSAASQKCTHVDKRGGLVIYTPEYSKVDLVCGTMPSIGDENVLFCAEGAFTSQFLNHFEHSNVGGMHVSGGKFYKGTKMGRNSGAFVYYNGTYRFFHQGNIEAEMHKAEKAGGVGFCQEMMIHKGKRVKTHRPDKNRNEFRALCSLGGKLCVIDTNGVAAFGDFINMLLKEGVEEALYLDMGPGWNYSWWRDSSGEAHKIHDTPTPYATNWVTFYK